MGETTGVRDGEGTVDVPKENPEFAQMTNDAGSDAFVVSVESLAFPINDLIADFNDAEGDVVDLSALLESLSGAPTVEEVASSTLGGGNTSVVVDDSGTGAGGTMTEVATPSGTHPLVSVLFDDLQTPTDIT
jgi:hypothetical protein